MKYKDTQKKHKVLWGFIYVGAFIVAFTVSAILKITYNPLAEEVHVDWNDTVGTVYTDIA